MLKYLLLITNKKMITIKADSELLEQIKKHYEKYLVPDDGQYIIFRAEVKKIIITAYKNTKGKDTKITFAGEGHFLEAKKWDNSVLLIKETEIDEPLGWFDIEEQIGSDEVGTGDFLGPICVCAAHVKKQDVSYLRKIGITDSKKMTDQFILEITPRLLKKFSYSQISLSNERYNELTEKGININEMKARLHNRVLLNLLKKHPQVKNVYVDKFVSEVRYFKYAATDQEIVQNVIFKTKGELRFPSVALASVIARYSFLKKMEALNKKYEVNIPFGASAKVDAFASNFIKRHGLETFKQLAKLNFANFKRLESK